MTTVNHPDPDIEALVNGHVDAWGRLYVRFIDRMRAAARHVLGNSDVVGDATQEAFRSLMQAGTEPLRNVSNVGAYFATAAMNKARDMVTRDDRRSVLEASSASASNHHVDPADIVAEAEALSIGFDLVEQMPEKVQYVYRERHLKNRPAVEVASELGIDASYIVRVVRKGAEFIAANNPYNELPPSSDSSSGTDAGTKDLT